MKRLGVVLAIVYVLAWAATVGAHAPRYEAAPGYVNANAQPEK